MIQLTGSEKQIEWATEIRNSFIVNCDKVVAKVEAGQASYIHPKVRVRFVEMVRERQAIVLERYNEAKDYINARNTLSLSGVEQTIIKKIQNDEKAKAAMSAPRQREVRA